MSLSSLYKGKGKGLIVRLAGIMVILSLLLSFALIAQPAMASNSLLMSLTPLTDNSNPNILVTYNTHTVRYLITMSNPDPPGGTADPVNYELYFDPPGPTGLPAIDVALTSDAASGQKVVNVPDGTKFSVGENLTISDVLHTESCQIASISLNALTMTANLVNPYVDSNNGGAHIGQFVQLNTPGTSLHLAENGSVTFGPGYTTPPQNGSVLTQVLNLDTSAKPVSIDAFSRFHATYVPSTGSPYYAQDSRDVLVQIIWPSTTVTIASDPVGPVKPGSTVNLTVTETNNTVGPTDANLSGGTDITVPSVTLTSTTNIPGWPNSGAGPLVLNRLSGTFTGTDGDVPNVLDGSDTGTPPGDHETWTWVVPVTVNANTTFTADGDGLDYLGNHVNFAVSTTEQITTEVDVVDTLVTITASPKVVNPTGKVTLTVTEKNTGNVAISSPQVLVTNDGGLLPNPITLDNTYIPAPVQTGGPGPYNDNILQVGETWTWTVTGVGPFTVNTTFTAEGSGTYDGQTIDSAHGYTDEHATVEVFTPNTLVTITASPKVVNPTGKVTLTVTEQNTGNVALTSPKVLVTNDGGLLPNPRTLDNTSSPAPVQTGGPGPYNDNILQVGETWTWTVTGVGPFTVNTTFTAEGDGIYTIDSTDYHITSANGYPGEHATVEVFTPNTLVTITASPKVVNPTDKVTLTVTEKNTGSVAISSPKVLVTNDGSLLPNPITLDNTYIPAPVQTGGPGPYNDNILQVGETWTWTVTGVGPFTVNTTFTAEGDGIYTIDSTDYHITSANGYPGEHATVEVFTPNTLVTITASPKVVNPTGKVTLTVTEQNTGNVALTSPKVLVTNDGGLLPSPRTLDFTTSPAPVQTGGPGPYNDNILQVGETWTWTVTGVGPFTVNTTFTAEGDGIYTLNGTDYHITSANGYPGEQATVEVFTPNTLVGISASPNPANTGGNVTLTVTEKNTGNVDLTSPQVLVTNDGGLLPNPITLDNTYLPAPVQTGGPGPYNDNILQVGETWTWTVTGVGPISAVTTFTAKGDGIYTIDSTDYHITSANGYPGELATTEVTIPGKIIIHKHDPSGNTIVKPGFSVSVYPDPYGAPGNTDTLIVKDNGPTGDPGNPVPLDPHDVALTYGTIELDNVPLGVTYLIIEQTAPAGWGVSPVDLYTTPTDPNVPGEVTSVDYPPTVPALSEWGIIGMIGAFSVLLVWAVSRKLVRKTG